MHLVKGKKCQTIVKEVNAKVNQSFGFADPLLAHQHECDIEKLKKYYCSLLGVERTQTIHIEKNSNKFFRKIIQH